MKNLRDRRASIFILAFILMSGLALLAMATEYDAASGDGANWESNLVDGGHFIDNGTTYNSQPEYDDNVGSLFTIFFSSTISKWVVTDFHNVSTCESVLAAYDGVEFTDSGDTIHWVSATSSITSTFSRSTYVGSTATGTFTMTEATPTPTPTATPTPGPIVAQVI